MVVLSVRDREDGKIAALDHGADDYVTKPFATGELLARLRVAQRHSVPQAESSVFRSGTLEVDFTARLVKLDGKEIKLTATLLTTPRSYFCSTCGVSTIPSCGGSCIRSFSSLPVSPNQDTAPQRVHIRAVVSTKLSFKVQNFVFLGTKYTRPAPRTLPSTSSV